MNPYHRAVRAALAGMERGRALRWLAAQSVDQEERDCIAAMDVYRYSTVQAADLLFLSTETVKRRRRAGYGQIAASLIQLTKC